MKSKKAMFRFYAELNDFLPDQKRYTSFEYRFSGKPSVKDAIEAIGVPHTEVEVMLMNREPCTFKRHLRDGDAVSVYPVFESFDVSRVRRPRKKPLRKLKFVLDVHLGKLAKLMRLAGFDSLYKNNATDHELVRTAVKTRRVLLTRDVGLLKNRRLSRGYWLRHTDPEKQLREVLRRFDLASLASPFSLCLECNGKLKRISKRRIEEKLLPKTKEYYNRFFVCPGCDRIYWQGSHYERMTRMLRRIIPSKFKRSS